MNVAGERGLKVTIEPIPIRTLNGREARNRRSPPKMPEPGL